MPNDTRPIYQEWFKKAEEDEIAGKEILEAKRALAPASFHFHQIAEKCLKGLLVFYGKKFPKTHDLFLLEDLLSEKIPGIKELHENLKILNRYYIEARYPGDFPEVTLKEAEKAYQAALEVKDFALNNVKQSHQK